MSIRGTGQGDPLTSGYPSYGSAGAYRLSLALDFEAPRPRAPVPEREFRI